MRSKITLLVIVVSILTVFPDTTAAFKIFDGKSQGFIFGMGVGGGLTNIGMARNGISDHLTKGAPELEFKIGYASTNTFQIYLFKKMAIFKMDDLASAYESFFDEIGKKSLKGAAYVVFFPFVFSMLPYKASHTVGGLVFSNYLEPETPSYYFSGGFGWSIIADPYTEELLNFDTNEMGGWGVYLGVGNVSQ